MPNRERDPAVVVAPQSRRTVSFGIVLGILIVAVAVAVAMVRTAKAASRSTGTGPDQPSLVSVRLRDASATEAYAEVAKSAGVRVTVNTGRANPSARFSFNTLQEPFWDVMARLDSKSQMHIHYVRREPEQEVVMIPTINMRDHQPVARDADGLFMGTLIDHVPDAQRAKPVSPTSRHASFLTVRLYPEPKVRTLLWHSIKVEEMVDEYGRAIEPQKHAHQSPMLKEFGALTLQLPERPWPRKIGRMRVTGKVLAAINSETAEVTGLMSHSSPTVSAAGFRIETNSRDTSEGKRLIQMILTRTGSYGPDWLRPVSRVDLLQPVVMDKQGRHCQVLVLDRDWFGRTCRFDVVVTPPQNKTRSSQDPGSPDKLVMEIPMNVTEYDVRLEFKDVNLY